MLYISVPDFLAKTAGLPRLSREEELLQAEAMARGDPDARRCLIESYLPMVAGHLRRCKESWRTLSLLYFCLYALEKAVDSFNFMQDSEPFSHRLSWHLRQATTRYIALHRVPD